MSKINDDVSKEFHPHVKRNDVRIDWSQKMLSLKGPTN